ncbi:hypothetical protein ISF_08120 [Cordyceps fumosorosea ARSEF 2679]|uniref:DUF7029 domain-containing protein n=1 Tax=Cordyceps fumosorosea (strain ARSEF 2679) TaxID=1081104 RepID=A0A167N6U0_CORFA|nr:hypothetical protein ISF_08120 [Cordyceps fumosorosea ARSEF 2679]OAA55199.1 hypothetical protein ISF_08120 [Cordyceps fumosorosea ARSEF 2679]
MLFNTIFTLLWAAALVSAFPSLSLPKWSPSRRSSVAAAPAQPEPTLVTSDLATVPGGFCGWVAVEVPVEGPEETKTEEHTGQQQTGQQHSGQQHSGQQHGGKQSQDEGQHRASAPSQTLAPSVHWSWDTSAVENVEPVAAKDDSKMYYGVSEPAKEGYFAFLTYRFTLPSVNLDHSNHVQVEYTKDSNLVVKFKTSDSFERAVESWETDKDLLLIATADGCTGPSAEDRCYFRATSCTVHVETRVIIAVGAPEHPENVMESAETEWGLWAPHSTPGANATGSAGNSFNYTTGSSGKAPSTPSHDAHGLAVASFGPSFDSALDDALGYHALLPGSEAFLNRIIADGEAIATTKNTSATDCVEPGSNALRRRRMLQARRALHARGWWSNLWNGFVDAVKTAYNTVADALSIKGDFNEPVSWDLPGADIPREASPWSPNSIALFKHETTSESGEFHEHVHIYCVDCGVSGQAVFSGKAKITPLKGIFDAEVALRANMKVVLKVGVDAEIRFSKSIQQDLFAFGLPGLSYGIVTVGPYISVAAKVGLEAAARGKLLVGGEMGLTQAQATLHIFEPSRSSASGWTPYFKPVLEAEGEIMLAASAGLPIGIKVGLKISSFEAALGIVEEPTISAAAQVAGEARYTEAGGLMAGFKPIDGCAGISTSLNWRNKLSLDILGVSSQVLHDTGLQPIVKGCINFKSSPRPIANAGALVSVVQNKGSVNSSSAGNSNITMSVKSQTSTSIRLPSTVSSTVSSTASSTASSSTVSSTASSTVSSTLHSTVPSSWPVVPSNSSTNSSSIKSTNSSSISPVKLPITSTTTASISTTSLPISSQISSTSVHSATTTSSSAPPPASPLESSTPKTNVTCVEDDATTTPQVFKDGHAFDLAPLLTSAGGSMVASCNDGNVYVAAASNRTSKTCNALWPTSKEAVVPFDGNLNVMHYYAGAMAAVGVSRLRASPPHKMPNDAVVAVLVPAPAADGSFFYMAADASDKVFYPIVCEFAGGAVPRVFLAKEVSAGVKMLEGGSVAESITGAKVDRCFGLSLSPQL